MPTGTLTSIVELALALAVAEVPEDAFVEELVALLALPLALAEPEAAAVPVAWLLALVFSPPLPPG
jgi:hypothetical protein